MKQHAMTQGLDILYFEKRVEDMTDGELRRNLKEIEICMRCDFGEKELAVCHVLWREMTRRGIPIPTTREQRSRK